MKVVTICGSLRFEKEMIDIAFDLEINKGYCVIQCVYDSKNLMLTEKQTQNIVDCHWRKIDISDAIYVVNIGGYIGQSTKNEIEYAKRNGKEVIYHEQPKEQA